MVQADLRLEPAVVALVAAEAVAVAVATFLQQFPLSNIIFFSDFRFQISDFFPLLCPSRDETGRLALVCGLCAGPEPVETSADLYSSRKPKPLLLP